VVLLFASSARVRYIHPGQARLVFTSLPSGCKRDLVYEVGTWQGTRAEN
jgi:hypothetical protein